MNPALFKILLVVLGTSFAVAFSVLVVPPLLASGDVLGAAAAGFVNPYSSGYALDAILCWCVLAVWVIYERKAHGIRHGWIALLLGAAPGVATGFAIYLLMRTQQLQKLPNESSRSVR